MKTYKEVLGILKQADWLSQGVARARRARQAIRKQRPNNAYDKQKLKQLTNQVRAAIYPNPGYAPDALSAALPGDINTSQNYIHSPQLARIYESMRPDRNPFGVPAAQNKGITFAKSNYTPQQLKDQQIGRNIYMANSYFTRGLLPGDVPFIPNSAEQEQLQKRLSIPTGNPTLDAHNKRLLQRQQAFKRTYGVGTVDFARNSQKVKAQRAATKRFMEEQLADMMDNKEAASQPAQTAVAVTPAKPVVQPKSGQAPVKPAPAAPVQTAQTPVKPVAQKPAAPKATPQQLARYNTEVKVGRGTITMTPQQAKIWQSRQPVQTAQTSVKPAAAPAAPKGPQTRVDMVGGKPVQMVAMPTKSGGRIWVTQNAYANMQQKKPSSPA